MLTDSQNPHPPAVTLDYASRSSIVRNRVVVTWGHVIILAALVILSIASLYIVYTNAADEPYFGGMHRSDAWMQVGGSSALITLWLLWCLGLIAFVLRRQIHPIFCLTILWALMAIVFLAETGNGYLGDIINYENNPKLWPQGQMAVPANRMPTTSAAR